MLGSGNICAFKIQRTAIPVMSHITWNSTPEWIACASIKSGRRHRLITLFTLRRLRPVAPYSRRDVSATMDAPLAFRAQASYEEPLLTHYAGSPRLASFSAHPFS